MDFVKIENFLLQRKATFNKVKRTHRMEEIICTLYMTLHKLVRMASTRRTDELISVQSPEVSDSLQPYGLQHARLSHPPLSPRVCSNSCSWGIVNEADVFLESPCFSL